MWYISNVISTVCLCMVSFLICKPDAYIVFVNQERVVPPIIIFAQYDDSGIKFIQGVLTANHKGPPYVDYGFKSLSDTRTANF